MKRVIWIWLCAGLVTSAWPVAAGMSAKEISERMQKALDAITSMSVEFVVTSQYETVDHAGTSSGRMQVLKKQNKMRLEQDNQVIVSDGKTVWTYVPENEQVIVSPAEQRQGGMRPDDFLFYYTKYYTPALDGEETLDGIKYYIMKLTANDNMAQLQELHVWVDSLRWLTRRVRYRDDFGTTTTVLFSDIHLNPPLPDDTFVMKIPEGVEVVDLR